MAIRVGKHAPDLKVEAYVRGEHTPRELTLSALRGRWVVLFFYPRDFTFICPTEIAAFAALHGDFEREGATLLGASTDSFYSHKAWFESDPRLVDVAYPVIADTSHRLASAFDVLLEDGAALRGTFVIDPDGVVRHMSVNELDVGRSVEEVLRVLQALKMGELCPVGWRRGQATLTSTDHWLAKAFPRLSDEVLQQAAESVETRRFAAGMTVFEQGEAPDRFYVIRRGDAEIVRAVAGGDDSVLTTLGPGSFFGEIGLLTEHRRTAAVRAKSDLEVLALGREQFQRLIEASEPTRDSFAAIVQARLAGAGR